MFDPGVDYLKTHLRNQELAADNTQGARWFASGVSEIGKLVSDTYDTKTENDGWEKEYRTTNPDPMKLVGWRLKVHFLTTMRQDIRDQFCSEQASTPKTAADYNRYAWARVRKMSMVVDALRKKVTEFLKGALRK